MADGFSRLLRLICASRPRPLSRTLEPNDALSDELVAVYADMRNDAYRLFLSVCYDAHQVRGKKDRDISKRSTVMQLDKGGESEKDHVCNFNSILAFLDALVSEAHSRRYKSIGCGIMSRMTGLDLRSYNDSLNLIEITLFEFWTWLLNVAALVDIDVSADDTDRLAQECAPSTADSGRHRNMPQPLFAAKARQFFHSHLFHAASLLLPDIVFESVGLIHHADAAQLKRRQGRIFEHSTAGQLRTKFLRYETDFFQFAECEFELSANSKVAGILVNGFLPSKARDAAGGAGRLPGMGMADRSGRGAQSVSNKAQFRNRISLKQREAGLRIVAWFRKKQHARQAAKAAQMKQETLYTQFVEEQQQLAPPGGKYLGIDLGRPWH